jgi:hypothetical protein
MKHRVISKMLSLLLVLCLAAGSFAALAEETFDNHHDPETGETVTNIYVDLTGNPQAQVPEGVSPDANAAVDVSRTEDYSGAAFNSDPSNIVNVGAGSGDWTINVQNVNIEPEASGNKVVPVGAIANHTTMPIASDMLMGNYFSNFKNHGDLNDYSFMVEYIPNQSTKACSSFLALGFDENGNPGFYPQTDGTYMAANSAWLSLNTASQSSVTAVYLGKAPVDEPLDPEDPEDPEESFLMGDVNDDGKLTIGDATQLINFLINDSSDNPEEPDPQKNGDNADEDHPVTEISFGAADINGDGIVNVTDLSRLIAMLLETQD